MLARPGWAGRERAVVGWHTSRRSFNTCGQDSGEQPQPTRPSLLRLPGNVHQTGETTLVTTGLTNDA